MVNLLLVSPQTQQSQGGMTVWTDTFLAQCSENGIACDLLNIATIGSRAVKGNSRRNFADEVERTKLIFENLKRMLVSQKYHVAHINTSCGEFGLIRDYLTVRRIKKLQPQCKRIVHFHCDVKKQTQLKYKMFFLKKLLSIADEALVLNEGNKKFLNEVCSISVVAVPNFIDETWVRNQEKPISECIKKAVFVGYVQPLKGAREIYELAEKFPQITFELIGDVKLDVREWEQPQNIVLSGPKERYEVVKSLDDADVFIFPTYAEGFSIALLESMSRGLPCITTTVGANAEMLEGNGGAVVAVGDVVAMAEAIEAMQDPIKRREMSVWNIQKVRSNYTVKSVMNQIRKLYI